MCFFILKRIFNILIVLSFIVSVSISVQVIDYNEEIIEQPYGFKINSHRVKREFQSPLESNKTSVIHINETPNHSDGATKVAESPITSINTNKNISVPTYVPARGNVGVNGSGIRKDPKVSEPINPEDGKPTNPSGVEANFDTDTVDETDEKFFTAHNITNHQTDTHEFYNSTFITDPKYFEEYWNNITSTKMDVHTVLSNAYRRASNVHLSFEFPFYGLKLKNVTVASGGFIYTGDYAHAWLAATQYIAPLMANFDTAITNDSIVRIGDNGVDTFSVIWENVNLHDKPNATFTFAATLYKNGDIIFAYKDLPVPIREIQNKEHPLKIGISDAYFTEKVVFFVRRKTIFEYHRVDFVDHDIKSGTILKFTALPTCLDYTTCEDCMNHASVFSCSWCNTLHSCSSGVDRNKQNWKHRGCDITKVTVISQCKPDGKNQTQFIETTSTTYIYPKNNSVLRENIKPATFSNMNNNSNSGVGSVVAAFMTIMVAASVAAWMLYAYKNPHTKSGQLFIKYRPSQWSWRRGEARYTAATIHM